MWCYSRWFLFKTFWGIKSNSISILLSLFLQSFLIFLQQFFFMFFCWQQFCYNFLEPAILNWIGRWGKFITDRAFIKHQATEFRHVFDQMSGHGNFSLTCLPDSHCYITGGPDCIEESESSAKLWRTWSSIWTGKRILLWRHSSFTISLCIKGVVPLGMTSATARRHLKLRWSPASFTASPLQPYW